MIFFVAGNKFFSGDKSVRIGVELLESKEITIESRRQSGELPGVVGACRTERKTLLRVLVRKQRKQKGWLMGGLGALERHS